jgi:hypothetical protein
MLSSGEAFFGWGEWCNAWNVRKSAPLPPPEKRAPLRVDVFFDLPSGMGRNALLRAGAAGKFRLTHLSVLQAPFRH